MDRNYLISSVLICLILACIVEAQPTSFDVTKYGAKGDGSSDIAQALLSAWKEACASTAPSTIIVPQGTFLLVQVKLQGPCKGPIELQVQGTIKAPSDPSPYKDGEWVMIEYVEHFTLSGGGTFDGQGAVAWSQNDCHKTGSCSKLPNNFSFNFLTNAYIHDVTSKDSKLFHVNVLGGKNVTFERFTISAPETSLNTDGIHIGRSDGVTITDSKIQTGDDCVSIGDGAKHVTVTKVTCGPGHGISVGSLGRYQNEEPVEGIIIKNCTLVNTSNGVRVKTWPASPNGVATDMHFEDIIVQNVGNPILIDQEYCPYNQCKKELPSLVKISQVSFKNIRGTSSTPVAVKLACSKSNPCQNLEVGDIELTYSGNQGAITTECTNVNPIFSGKQIPPVCAGNSTQSS